MSAAVRVRSGMAIGGVIAATNHAALQADAQVQPWRAAGQALLAAVDRLRQPSDANAVEMGARGHRKIKPRRSPPRKGQIELSRTSHTPRLCMTGILAISPPAEPPASVVERVLGNSGRLCG